MREIFLKICPEGTYSSFNETLGFYDCTSCHELCKNCNGNSSSNCTECNFPYKLIQAEQICVIVEGCPNGYFQDSKTDSCQPCHDYCITCINTPYQCPKCKA
jgi:proprotein convertase subtilisin/kexin type 5